MAEHDEHTYPCLMCEEKLPENMFAHRPAPGGGTRLDGWCLDCRGAPRPGRSVPGASGASSGARGEERKARQRARGAAMRRLRDEHEELYQQYRHEAQVRAPLPPLKPGQGRAEERMRAMARHTRRAEQRLRADYPQAFEAYLEQALADEGYPPRGPGA